MSVTSVGGPGGGSKFLPLILQHSFYIDRVSQKKEQRFILSRLTTVDQQFCLEQIRYLYQTYFNLGSQHQVWPLSELPNPSFYISISRIASFQE